MEKHDYEKLNYYLNGCFKELENNDFFLLDNIYFLGNLSNDYYNLTQKYNLEQEQKQNSLTYQDVYLLAREIIESIDESYLNFYDDLINSGKLEFRYENLNHYNSIMHCNLGKDLYFIDIDRAFNYLDVIVLVHEFMHCMNHINHNHNRTSYNQDLLTEFISIYFEEYAKKYLMKKGVSKTELYLNERFNLAKKQSFEFNHYYPIILAYNDLGKIDNNTYNHIRNNYFNVSNDVINSYCNYVLENFEKEERKYKMDILFEKAFNEEELFYRLTNLFSDKYILNSVLAYTALEKTTKEKMVYLCNHINDYKYAYMSVDTLLKTVDININELSLDIIERKIIENGVRKVKQW